VDRCNGQIVGQLRYAVGSAHLPDTLLKLSEMLRVQAMSGILNGPRLLPVPV
jgi:hypothetical protein